MEPGPPEIVIRFERGASPIAGHVTAYGRAPCAFTGWAGLFAVLRAAAPDGQVVEPSPERT